MLPDAFRGRTNSLRDFYEYQTAEAIDDKTVRMPIKFPAATFMVNLASDYMKMYPEHVAGSLSQEDVNCCPDNMIGSGPFIFKAGSWQKQEGYEYVRNPNYFKAPRPFFDGFKVFLIQDVARAIATLKVGQADGTYYPVSVYLHRIRGTIGTRYRRHHASPVHSQCAAQWYHLQLANQALRRSQSPPRFVAGHRP